MTTTPPQLTRKPKMEKEVEDALRFARIEAAIETLVQESQKNQEATRELVDAWKSSKWIIGFIKASAAFGLVILGVVTAWRKFWGGV